MSLLDTSRGRIRAILGPTNTGKTHLAMERMQAYESGMIGFPLRLLARENYDRLVAAKGAGSVALITGEEKIIPLRPKWYICTVESMPISEQVDFVAVDEIQLCEDRDRGHIFTDRLLHARGRYETMFLGSDTMADLIRRLVEDVEIESRPRLSTLRYAGRQKLTRLPRRTAIVAFSVDEVYAIAETMRQHRGGTAVVLGALSPRTRNAQVAMYQAGEVDYLVATDAIGMGLNMDVDHVAFASLRKYDGHHMRPLRPWEIGQIAGRAGRHMNDGSFGVTNNLPDLDEDVVDLVEGHEFTPITHIQWRNRNLDFRSVGLLMKSLLRGSNRDFLLRTRDATDQLALQMLMKEEEVMLRATTPDRVELLWDVCQVPDFRKITPDHHAEFLKLLYLSLVDQGCIPEDLLAERINRLDNAQGEIDQLTQRLAHMRSWAYVTHRSNWLRSSFEWQEKAREIEEKISDALHQSLMLRFVDKRAALIGKKDKGEKRAHFSSVSQEGVISVEGHVVGRMNGFHFQPDRARDHKEARQLAAAASNSIATCVKERVQHLETALDNAFRLTPLGRISWEMPLTNWKGQELAARSEPVEIARLVRGDDLLHPKVILLSHDISDASLQRAILDRLENWLRDYLGRKLKLLSTVEVKGKVQKLSPAARGLLFQLREGLGSVASKAARDQVAGLPPEDRKILASAGLRFGRDWIYWKWYLNGESLRLRSLLSAVWQGVELPALPRKAQLVLPVDYATVSIWPLIGYVAAGPVALRQDHYEAVMALLRQEVKKSKIKSGWIEKSERLSARIKCSLSELSLVIQAVGGKEITEEGRVYYRFNWTRSGGYNPDKKETGKAKADKRKNRQEASGNRKPSGLKKANAKKAGSKKARAKKTGDGVHNVPTVQGQPQVKAKFTKKAAQGAGQKTDGDMVASQQVTGSVEQLQPPPLSEGRQEKPTGRPYKKADKKTASSISSQNRSEKKGMASKPSHNISPKSSQKSSRKSKSRKMDKVNPDSPFAGLRDLLDGRQKRD